MIIDQRVLQTATPLPSLTLHAGHFVCKAKSNSIDLLIIISLSEMNQQSHSNNSVSVDVATEGQIESFFDGLHFETPLTTIPPLHCYSGDATADALVPLPNSFNDHFVDDLSFLSSNHLDVISTFSLPLAPYHHDDDPLPPLSEVPFDHGIQSFSWDSNIISQDDVIVDVVVPLNSTSDHDSMIINPCELANVASFCVCGDDQEKKTRMERRMTSTGRLKLAGIGLEEMKSYFYMPITRAAKEMNVGVTLLKKRCRELGIRRWPHRKMKSLNTLIHNVQELGKVSDEECIMRELESLEEHKRLMEENPELQLTERTKKLRQACFKANYKKKRRSMQLLYFDPQPAAHPY